MFSIRTCMLLSSLLSAAAFVSAVPLDRSSSPLEIRQTGFPDPNDDAFYTSTPMTLGTSNPGDILKTRAFTSTITTGVKSSTQLYYVTTNTEGNRQGNVATVFEPNKPKSPPQILDYNTYTDSASFDCNPSWAFVQGSPSQSKTIVSLDAAIFIQYALNQGIYVVVPDHEGPQAAFVAGFQEGMATLDSIRALKKFYKLPADTGIAMTGYSGGAHVTAWAANLAGTYAKDLNILGVAHGGTPIDLRETFLFLNGGLFAGFAGAGLVGVMNAYPDLNKYISDNLTPAGTAEVAKFRSRNYCVGSVATGDPFVDFLKFITVPDPLNQPIPKRVLDRETLFANSTVGVSNPTFPRFQWHALLDEIVPFSGEQQFVKEQCAKGANIQFQIFPVAEHITAEILGIPGALVFLQQLFTGKTPKVICGTAIPSLPGLNSPTMVNLIGQDAVNSLLALNGKKIRGETVKLF